MCVSAWLAVACGDDDSAGAPAGEAGEPSPGQDEATASAEEQGPSAEEIARRELDANYPHHAAVTGIELRVYAQPDPEATVVGWLRTGSLVRLGERERKAGCKGGWYPIHPTGWVCPADGLEVRDGPIEIELPTDEGWKLDQVEKAAARGAMVLPPPADDEPLPYDYYFVKEPTVPSYHRLPSRDEQRAALAKSARYHELLEKNEERAERYLAGESDDGPPGTEVTARYLDRGFFVASNGSEVRAFRRFVRTTQGRYIKQAQLQPREGGDFQGVELGEERSLPVAWAVRTSHPLIAEVNDDGSVDWDTDEEAEPIERLTLLEQWRGLERMGGPIMHVLETERGPRYLRSWFAATAFPMQRPEEVPPGQTWVHIDTREQVAVLYEGDDPVYATLVSTGIDEHETPVGVFQVRYKRVTDTMADLGPEAGDDRYRVEDVPWTQYFEGSIALHGAFWHTRFGIRRSHGCVNLAPPDAQRFFQATAPAVPDGWHGLSTEGTRFEGSYVVVTDEDLTVLGTGADEETEGEQSEAQGAQEEAVPEAAAEAEQEPEPEVPRATGIRASKNTLEPWRARQPEEVTYTIQRGGTARFVANLYGLYHHEMEELNPDLDLDRELGPGTELVIYRQAHSGPSRSVGYPSDGSLTGAAPVPEGPGRELKATPRKSWATRRTVGILDAVLRAWPKVEPHAKPLLVGNMSLRRGGKLEPHGSHQSGRDVDLGYPQNLIEGETYNWREMDARRLDARRTWRLLHLLRATGEVEVIFIDRSLQKLLYEYAREHNALSKAELERWLEYPRPTGSGEPIVQHVAGHIDHLHVRFRCGGQKGCESKR